MAPHQEQLLGVWRDHLDALLPRRPLLRADEIASAVGVNQRTIHRLFETYDLSGLAALPGHSINSGTGKRAHRRYRRDGVILWLADTANYTPQDMRHRLISVMARQTLADLVLLQQALGEIINKRRAS